MDLKGYRYPKDLILLSVHWYLKHPLSYRNLEEMLGERGMGPDHSSVYRWVQTFTPGFCCINEFCLQNPSDSWVTICEYLQEVRFCK